MLEGALQRSWSSPAIDSMGSLASTEDMREELRRAGSACGKINSVVHLPSPQEPDVCQFLVTFDKAQDAMAASQLWRSYLFGFTSVLVAVKRQVNTEMI